MSSKEELLQMVIEEGNHVLEKNPICSNISFMTEALGIDGEVITYIPESILDNNFVELALSSDIPYINLEILQNIKIKPDDELYYLAIIVSGLNKQTNILHWIKTVVSKAKTRKRNKENLSKREKCCSIALSRFYEETGEWPESSEEY